MDVSDGQIASTRQTWRGPIEGKEGGVGTTELKSMGTLADIWCNVLSLESVSANDDFFALGNSSRDAAMHSGVHELLAEKPHSVGLTDGRNSSPFKAA